MKGIVVDIKGKYAIVMTRDGCFEKVKSSPEFVVGCETDFYAAPQHNAGIVKRMAAIAATLVIALGIGWGVYGIPYSYISIDINPSIQLTSNLIDRIIKVEALNDDGRKLVSSTHIENMRLTDGMAEILGEAVRDGYIGDDDYNAVVFSITSKNEDRTDKLEVNLKQRAESELDNHKVVSDVIIGKYPLEKLEASRKTGISPGKLALIEELVKAKPEMSVDSLKNVSVRDIIRSLRHLKEDSKTENGNKGDNGSTYKNGAAGDSAGNEDLKQNNDNQDGIKDKDNINDGKQDEGRKDEDKKDNGSQNNGKKEQSIEKSRNEDDGNVNNAAVILSAPDTKKPSKDNSAEDKDKDNSKEEDNVKDNNKEKDKDKNNDNKDGRLNDKDEVKEKAGADNSGNNSNSNENSSSEKSGAVDNTGGKAAVSPGTAADNNREKGGGETQKDNKKSSDGEGNKSSDEENKGSSLIKAKTIK